MGWLELVALVTTVLSLAAAAWCLRAAIVATRVARTIANGVEAATETMDAEVAKRLKQSIGTVASLTGTELAVHELLVELGHAKRKV